MGNTSTKKPIDIKEPSNIEENIVSTYLTKTPSLNQHDILLPKKLTCYQVLDQLIYCNDYDSIREKYDINPSIFKTYPFITKIFESKNIEKFILFGEFCIELIKDNNNMPEYGDELELCCNISNTFWDQHIKKFNKKQWNKVRKLCDDIGIKLIEQGRSNINKVTYSKLYKEYADYLTLAIAFGLNILATVIAYDSNFDFNIITNKRILIKACKNNLEPIALILLEKNIGYTDCITHADMYRPDNDTGTPLLFACKYKMTDVAINLIKTNKCRPNFINNKNKSALLYACNNNLTDVILLLIPFCQDKLILLIDAENKSAFEYIIINKNNDVFDKVFPIIIKESVTFKKYLMKMFKLMADIEYLYGVQLFLEKISFDEQFLIDVYHNVSLPSIKEIFTNTLHIDDQLFKIDKFGIDIIKNNNLSDEGYSASVDQNSSDKDNNTKQCVICYEECSELYCITPCKHTFYIDNCLEKINKCPFCRANIVSKEKIFMQSV
jgi:hypothetical protein